MKSIGEALREIVPCFAPIGVARRPLLDALGSVLCEDIAAQADLPSFDNSAMDGYALRFGDLKQDVRLRVQGESRAGGGARLRLEPGAALRIFTGAELPEGADTVVMQENTTREGDSVRIDELPAGLGSHVRKRGEDIAKGSVALRAGTSIGPAEIGLLAALDRHSVSVYQRPRVALVSTGDELREIGAAGEPGTIVGSNAYALAALVLELGGEPWILPSVPDQVSAIVATLEQALAADAVIAIGGASVGDYDCMGAAFDAAGIALRFRKVAIKPGKPVIFGVRGRVPVLGLPGNPVSALVTFEVFVRPALRHMLGHAEPYPTLIEVELAHDHRHATGRVELARAALVQGAAGRVQARLHARQGSGSLDALCGADALVVLPGNTAHFARGMTLTALPLRTARSQRETPFE